jgi:TatD family-associated radical SAM protein
MTITYEYGGSLYVNVTNRCDCACTFCLRQNHSGGIYTDNLWLDREPDREEILNDILRRDLDQYEQLVFCGYGEPTFRLDDILWVCARLKQQRDLTIRMDTNGHAGLILGRDVVPELVGKIDVLSVSLNAATQEKYLERTRPAFGAASWQAMLDFAAGSVKAGIRVILTVVDLPIPPEEIEACREIAEDMGAELRVRAYIE